MTVSLAKILIAALALAFATSAAADAATARKHHKRVASVSGPVAKSCRGANLYPCGPVQWNQVYFGDDPDPNIRFQLWRDFNAKFGGGPE